MGNSRSIYVRLTSDDELDFECVSAGLGRLIRVWKKGESTALGRQEATHGALLLLAEGDDPRPIMEELERCLRMWLARNVREAWPAVNWRIEYVVHLFPAMALACYVVVPPQLLAMMGALGASFESAVYLCGNEE